MPTLALDVGGTKIAVGLADESGALLHTAVRPTRGDRDTETVWTVVAELITETLAVAGGRVDAVYGGLIFQRGEIGCGAAGKCPNFIFCHGCTS